MTDTTSALQIELKQSRPFASYAEEARKTVLANLVPGVIVMPSGIFAVTRAQEAGCQYIRAS